MFTYKCRECGQLHKSPTVPDQSMCPQCQKYYSRDRRTIVEAMAREFVGLLVDEIGLFDLCRAADDNERETHPDICHTCDYCDANKLMNKAMGLFAHATDDMMDEAWAVAKSNHFWIDNDGGMGAVRAVCGGN